MRLNKVYLKGTLTWSLGLQIIFLNFKDRVDYCPKYTSADIWSVFVVGLHKKEFKTAI